MKGLDYSKSITYFRDQWVPFKDANLSVASSPVLYGLSIYTVFNVIWNSKTNQLNIFRLDQHYKRLCNSARIMDFKDFSKQYSYKKFQEIMLELLAKNKVQEDALVRVTVFIDELIAGTKIHGLKNSISAYVYPMGEILPRSGIDACVSSWTRSADNMIPSRAKVNGQYVNASLIKNEAVRNGFHDAIVLDSQGHVSEGPVANLFLVRDGALITPDNSADLLEGITRASILQLAGSLGIKTVQRPVDRTELYISDEVFMCGSSAHVTPVLSIDRRPVANSKIGPITSKIITEYKKLQLGENPEFANWIIKV